MRTIGITGGVGSGKSALLHYIETHYRCRIIKADVAAHELSKPGGACFEPLVDCLGKEILTPQGEIDKQCMAAKIFSEKKLLEKVNGIVHPEVKRYVLREIKKERKKNEVDFFFLEAALLIEEHYDTILDELWYIDTRESIRRERLKASRNYSDEKISQMIASQLREEEFRRACRVIIENHGSLEEACRQIDTKLGAYLC